MRFAQLRDLSPVRIPVRITGSVWGLVLLSTMVALAAPVRGRAEAAGCRSLICLVNEARAAQGLPALRESRRLDRASRLRALAIRRCGQFSHTACGEPFRGVFARAGYRRRTIGENLAWGTGRARSSEPDAHCLARLPAPPPEPARPGLAGGRRRLHPRPTALRRVQRDGLGDAVRRPRVRGASFGPRGSRFHGR